MTRRVLPTGRLEEALRAVVGVVKDVVPVEAQLHLLAAQRELVLAVASVIEHHSEGEADGDDAAGAEGMPEPGPAKRSAPKRKGGARTRRPTRVSLD